MATQLFGHWHLGIHEVGIAFKNDRSEPLGSVDDESAYAVDCEDVAWAMSCRPSRST